MVDEVLDRSSRAVTGSDSNALEFIEDKNAGLGVTLAQVQRIMVKAVFGIPMDFRMGEVVVWDMYKENLLYTFKNDLEYLHYVYEEGRTNISNWQDIPPWGYATANLVVGRRGGKSEIVAGMGCVCLRNLLSHFNPQDHYGLMPGSPIDFTLLGTDEESSTTVYDKMRARINGCNYFDPYVRKNDVKEMSFVSLADRDNRDIVPSITVKAYPCTTRAVRGPSSLFLALDEFAHFQSSKDANSDDIYKSATPSSSNFPNKEDPERVDSHILMISSPLGRIGKMYESHKRALEDGVTSGTFTFRCSTVEMYPKIPRQRLAEFRKESGDAYPAEYGGCFMDGSGSYVPPAQVDLCVDKDRPNQTRFSLSTVGRKYFWGFDLGMKNDATALAIGHLEMVEGDGIHLILDYVDRMMVHERFTGPGVENVEEMQKYEGKQWTELDVVDIVSWLFYMHQILPCFRGMTDQHAGAHFKQLLQLNGITAMELVHLTEQINSKMFQALRGFMQHGAARLPDVPKFITEFKALEATYRNKYTLAVAAPGEVGAHDDMGDAVALVALQAQEWLDTDGKLDLDPSGRTLAVNPNLLPPVPIMDVNGVSVRDLQIEGRIRMIENRPLISAKQLQRGGYGGGGRSRR